MVNSTLKIADKETLPAHSLEKRAIRAIIESKSDYKKISKKAPLNLGEKYTGLYSLDASLINANGVWFRVGKEFAKPGAFSGAIKKASKIDFDEDGNITFKDDYLVKITDIEANKKTVKGEVEKLQNYNVAAEASFWCKLGKESYSTKRVNLSDIEKEYLFMPKVAGEDLEQILEHAVMPTSSLRLYGLAMLKLMQELHEKGIAHGDFHEGNMLFETNGAKDKEVTAEPIDFGASVDRDEKGEEAFNKVKERDVYYLKLNLKELFYHCLRKGLVYQALKVSRAQLPPGSERKNQLNSEISFWKDLTKKVDKLEGKNFSDFESLLSNSDVSLAETDNLLLTLHLKGMVQALKDTFSMVSYAGFSAAEQEKINTLKLKFYRLYKDVALSSHKKLDALKELAVDVKKTLYGETGKVEDSLVYQNFIKQPIFSNVPFINKCIVAVLRLLGDLDGQMKLQLAKANQQITKELFNNGTFSTSSSSMRM